MNAPIAPGSDVRRRPASSDAPTAAVDLVIVALFVLLGRTSHREGGALGGYLTAAWPFLAGTGVGWIAVLLARRAGAQLPGRSIPGGAVVAGGTIVGGMTLRRLFTDGGTPVSFLVVATTFVTVFLLGWRWLAGRRSRRDVPAG